MADYPFDEVARAVDRLAGKGWLCFQKFTCAKCGARLTMDEPNVLYKTGTCDKCGHITNIEEQGCNYMLVGRNKSGADLNQAVAHSTAASTPQVSSRSPSQDPKEKRH